MRKVFAIFVSIIMCFSCFVGCATQEPELPDGVVSYRNHNYYVINITKEQAASYFNLTGPTNTYVVTDLGASSSVEVKYREVEQGGWLAYSDAVNKIIYIPSEYQEDDVSWVAQKLAGDLDSYMTIEQAKEYISFLK